MLPETIDRDEWLARRIGKVTASKLGDLMARTKSGWGAGRANYMGALIAERLTGQKAETFQSAAMLHGIETEPEAIAAYEFFTGNEVTPSDFVEHPTIEMAGASPDGLVGADGLIEVKCPQVATHIDFLLGKSIDNKYVLQMQFQMACTGRAWCDFASYQTAMPESLRLKVTRVNRDDKAIAELEHEIPVFMSELVSKLEALEKLAA